jgi:hypothetical protein
VPELPWLQKWSCLPVLAESVAALQQQTSESTDTQMTIQTGLELGREILAGANQSADKPPVAAAVVWFLCNTEIEAWRDPSTAENLAQSVLAKENAVADRVSLLVGLAAAHYRCGEYADCLQTYEQLAKEPLVLSARASLMQAMCFHQVGDKEQAQESLKIGLSRLGTTPNPDDKRLAAEAAELIR